jgi:c-di-GMP-binding flagellar brake protein YcgR
MLQSYRNHIETVSTSFHLEAPEAVEVEFINEKGDVVRLKAHISNTTLRWISLELVGATVGSADLVPDIRVFVAFIRQDALYGFESNVLAMTKLPILFVSSPQVFYRIQRREFFRLRVNLPVEYALLEEEHQEPVAWRRGFVAELSEYGLKMIANQLVPRDTPIAVKFTVPTPSTDLSFVGTVLRIIERRQGAAQLVVIYPNMPVKMRDIIRQYLLMEQRAMLRGERTP